MLEQQPSSNFPTPSSSTTSSSTPTTPLDPPTCWQSFIFVKPPSNLFLLSLASFTFLSFAVAEIFGAFAANSLSLLGDAVTMIVDSLTYFFNLLAERGKNKPTATDVEILKLELYSPLVSITVLLGISVYIISDAVGTIRSIGGLFGNTTNVDGSGGQGGGGETTNSSTMLIFSSINLFFDAMNLLYFYKSGSVVYSCLSDEDEEDDIMEKKSAIGVANGSSGNTQVLNNNASSGASSSSGSKYKRESNMNMCSAYTHVIADTLRSIAVLIAAAIAKADARVNSEVSDAYAAIFVSVVIFFTTLPLLTGLRKRFNQLQRLKREVKMRRQQQPLLPS